MKYVDISFVIPALNEEYYLPNLLKSIGECVPNGLSFEIVVADNGSTDNTVLLAEKLGAKVLVDTEATISKLRNIAVSETSGGMLVFLDADISLTEEWGRNISSVYDSIHKNSNFITGSRCGIPNNASWIEDIWFQPLVDKPSKYINSGHLITSRSLFDEIGGFDEYLTTGEDYAFGVSAQALKATIVNNPLLRVIHYGYPKSIKQFVRREIWHGKGDCESFHNLVSSKVALVSFLLVLFHFIMLTGIIASSKAVVFSAVFMIVSICVGSAIYRYKVRAIKQLLLVSFLFYLYYFSRFLSCATSSNITSARSVLKD